MLYGLLRSILAGIRINKKYKYVLGQNPIFKSNLSYISKHAQEIKGGSGKVLVYDSCLLLYSSFLLIFISEDLGTIRKIDFSEISSTENITYKYLRFFSQERIMVFLKNGERYSVKVFDNKRFKQILDDRII